MLLMVLLVAAGDDDRGPVFEAGGLGHPLIPREERVCNDFRVEELPASMPDVPQWAPELYASIKQELMKLEKTAR